MRLHSNSLKDDGISSWRQCLRTKFITNCVCWQCNHSGDFTCERLYSRIISVCFGWSSFFLNSGFDLSFNVWFRLEKKQDQIKYADIILDFSYFKISEVQEKKIEENTVSWTFILALFNKKFIQYVPNLKIELQELRDLDDEVRENYLEILTRCYLAFESVHQYVSDLKYFLHEVNEGMYIQQSLESILQDVEGKQILVGCMTWSLLPSIHLNRNFF